MRDHHDVFKHLIHLLRQRIKEGRPWFGGRLLSPSDHESKLSDLSRLSFDSVPMSHEEKIHLLRALLRECSYLPDPQSRGFLKRHVLERFRDYKDDFSPKKFGKPGKAGAEKTHSYDQRIVDQLRTGRRSLVALRKANDGYHDALFKTLLMTYGRVGPRRYKLLKPLYSDDNLPGEDVRDDVVTRNLKKQSNFPNKLIPHVSKLSHKLEVLIQSQALVKPPYPRKKATGLKWTVPKKNKLGSPMPVKRTMNAVPEWIKRRLESVLPPLPDDEYEHLKKLANGTIVWSGLVSRRAMGKPLAGSENPSDYLSRYQVYHQEDSALLQELGLQDKPKAVGGPDHANKITARSMRRMWAQIFQMCPVFSWDEKNNAWKVAWGKVIPKTNNIELSRILVAIDPELEAEALEKRLIRQALQVHRTDSPRVMRALKEYSLAEAPIVDDPEADRKKTTRRIIRRPDTLLPS